MAFLAIILHDFLSFLEETFLHRVSGDDCAYHKSGDDCGWFKVVTEVGSLLRSRVVLLFSSGFYSFPSESIWHVFE